MLPFENMVADYIKEDNCYVAYQVTPIYRDVDLVAVGVQMEGYSISDSGESICFNVFCYNVQPGVEIDYSTGESKLIDNIDHTVALIYFEWRKFLITT
jgi:DNA-entry nuclease